ncbi:hypothetical protein [Qipengyuania sediminis]|uniref:hypothetical protein n=1 Tax=Qipengyuania sediminis TaxID=1532023 RepID=UPI00105A64B8|nr:hypothetical protein [Qipengyuania sediminis]
MATLPDLESAAMNRPQRNLPVSRAIFDLSDRAAFDAAVSLSVEWIANTAAVELPSEAAHGDSFQLDAGSRATVNAFRLQDEQGHVWAARTTYLGDKVAGRKWLTDIFVEQRAGSLTRYGAQLICQCSADDPGFDHSRPRIVRDLIGKLAAEADGESLTNEVVPVLTEEVSQLAGLLYNPERRLPVVLISVDDTGGAQVDLERLANRLSGTAHLRSIATEAGFELTRMVGKRMSTFNGAIRLYMPGLETETEDPFKHPLWLCPHSGSNPRATHQIASRVLPLQFRDSEGSARFWRVGLLRQAASRALANSAAGSREDQLAAEVEALRAEIDVAKEAGQTAEALMTEEAAKLTELQAEFARLEDENHSLRERMRGLAQASSKTHPPLAPDDVQAVFEREPTLETSLRIVTALFPDRVTVLESALESARDSYAFRHRSKAFELLWSLSTSYWTTLAEGGSDVTARQCFGASYAAKEAETLSKAGRQRRTFIFEGAELEMERHLKIGVADNKAETLRIHFEWIADRRLIVIGHCGAHLNF